MRINRFVITSLALLLLLSLPGWVSAQQQDAKIYLHFFGGFNRVLEYGCDCDYVQGENDFPVTPAHTTASVGMGLGYMLGKGFGLELDGRYHSNTEVTLTDPSDGDTVNIDTAKHYAITLNLLYQILKDSVRPYVLAGAGIDTLVDVQTQIYNTDMGYEFELREPDQKTDFMFNLGGGVEFILGRTVGVRLDARYVNIPKTDDHDTIQSINATAGLTVRF